MIDTKKFLDMLNSGFKEASQKYDHASLSKFSLLLVDLENYMREYIQTASAPQIMKIVEKLNKGENLSIKDLDLIQYWLVGDAEYYAKLENNFDDWMSEIKRLVGEISSFVGKDITVEDAVHIRALLMDAMRTAGDVAFYLQQKERLEKFEESVKELDPDERMLLIKLLVSKLGSDDY